jgi:hypothetical protein
MVTAAGGNGAGMNRRLQTGLTVVREIEALGARWHDWRQGDWRQSQAVETLRGRADSTEATELVVGREEFNVAGEIMVCLQPGCAGFVRGLVRRDDHVYWRSACGCPRCGQRYLIQDS